MIELLVVIVIVAALASLVFMISQRAMARADASAEVSNLRQVGVALSSIASDLGYYPVGWDVSQSLSWADFVVDDGAAEGSSITQLPILWSPRMADNIPVDLNREAVTHFGGNPAIFPEIAVPGEEENTETSGFTRRAQLQRPAEQVLLASATARSANADYDEADPVMSDLISVLGPLDALERGDAQAPLSFPPGLNEREQFGSQPDFFRIGNGKAMFLFADGHVEGLAPAELRERHFAITY